MKKFVSMFLAVCAMSTMSVSAFAQQAGAVNVTSDQAMKLSFGEETFSQMLLPGETYTYPLYLEQEDGTLVPLSDEHLKDIKLRAEKKNGKSAVSSFQVEEKDDAYHLEVKTEAGWPTKQTEVEGAVKAVKRSNGQVVSTADVELTVGYPTIRDEALEGAKSDEYILVDNSAPVISTKQFQQLDEDVDGGKVTFTNGLWNYQVRISGQEAVNLLHNERAIKEVSSKFEDQNFKYVSFPGGPAFDFTGTMTIDVSEEMEEFGGTFYVYRYLRGVLERIDATVDLDEETVSFETKNLGRFVITDREIADGTVVDESFLPHSEPQTERPSVQAPAEQQTSGSVSEHQDYQSGAPDKKNPETGAEDYAALAAAAASVSVLAGIALKGKKR
jgi:hypothetical protein